VRDVHALGLRLQHHVLIKVPRLTVDVRRVAISRFPSIEPNIFQQRGAEVPSIRVASCASSGARRRGTSETRGNFWADEAERARIVKRRAHEHARLRDFFESRRHIRGKERRAASHGHFGDNSGQQAPAVSMAYMCCGGTVETSTAGRAVYGLENRDCAWRSARSCGEKLSKSLRVRCGVRC